MASLVSPRGGYSQSQINSIGHFVLYFASRDSGERWAGDHPGTLLLTLEQAFEVGRRVNREVFGAEAERGTAGR